MDTNLLDLFKDRHYIQDGGDPLEKWKAVGPKQALPATGEKDYTTRIDSVGSRTRDW